MAVSGFGRGVIKMTAASDAKTSRMFVTTIRWVGATTAGHVLTITDTAGNILLEAEADGANFTDMHPLFKRVDGIIVDAMDSGTVYIYVD